MDTPDPHTAVFRYSRPMPQDLLLRALADLGYIAPKHVFAGTDVLNNPANTAPIGTGPFKFVRYERGQYVIAERNPSYWKPGEPYLDRIVWRFINDRASAAAAAALESGQVQVSPLSSLSLADMDRLQKDPRFEVSTRGNEANAVMNTVEYNCRNKHLSDVRVRRAIAHALDIPFFCENFLYGFGKPATGPIPSSSPAFFPQPAASRPTRSTRRAPTRCWTRPGSSAARAGSGSACGCCRRWRGRTCRCSPPSSSNHWTRWASRSRSSSWTRPGSCPAPTATGISTSPPGGTSIAGTPPFPPPSGIAPAARRGAPWTNQFGWKSDRADALMDAAASEIDPAKRRALYADVVAEVNAGIPVLMAIERVFLTASSRKLVNANNNPRWASSDWADLQIQ